MAALCFQPIYKVDSAGSSRLLLVAGRILKIKHREVKVCDIPKPYRPVRLCFFKDKLTYKN